MRAMVLTGFGDQGTFEAQDIPKPEPNVNEVLVKVYATSVNPVDYQLRSSEVLSRLGGPIILGFDVSGVVEAVGDSVVNFQVGDEVFYTPEINPERGSYAEYHAANEEIVAHKPLNLSHVQAAAIPLAGSTAWEALVERAKVQVGETLLIHGAGSVGTLAIQIGKAAGARVLATCGKDMVGPAEELGAYRAIDTHSEDFVEVIQQLTDGFGVDVVLDTVGGDALSRSIPLIKPFGRMVEIVGPIEGRLDDALVKNVSLHFSYLQRARYKLEALRILIERDQLKPVIDSILDLSKVNEAHKQFEEGVKGKIVLKVSEHE